jgi:hypothetical protein
MHKNKCLNSRAGTTLIEVLVYIALFTLLIGTLLGVAYQTLASAGQVSKNIALAQEGDFILRKIGWALDDASAVTLGPKPSDVLIARFSGPSAIAFSQNGNFIYLNSGAGAVALNSQNFIASNLVFTKTQTASEPAEIRVSFSLANAFDPSGGQIFTLTKFLKQ